MATAEFSAQDLAETRPVSGFVTGMAPGADGNVEWQITLPDGALQHLRMVKAVGDEHWRTEERDENGRWTATGGLANAAAATAFPRLFPGPGPGGVSWLQRDNTNWEVTDSAGGVWKLRRNARLKRFELTDAHSGGVTHHPDRASGMRAARTIANGLGFTLQFSQVPAAVPPAVPPAPPAAPAIPPAPPAAVTPPVAAPPAAPALGATLQHLVNITGATPAQLDTFLGLVPGTSLVLPDAALAAAWRSVVASKFASPNITNLGHLTLPGPGATPAPPAPAAPGPTAPAPPAPLAWNQFNATNWTGLEPGGAMWNIARQSKSTARRPAGYYITRGLNATNLFGTTYPSRQAAQAAIETARAAHYAANPAAPAAPVPATPATPTAQPNPAQAGTLNWTGGLGGLSAPSQTFTGMQWRIRPVGNSGYRLSLDGANTSSMITDGAGAPKEFTFSALARGVAQAFESGNPPAGLSMAQPAPTPPPVPSAAPVPPPPAAVPLQWQAATKSGTRFRAVDSQGTQWEVRKDRNALPGSQWNVYRNGRALVAGAGQRDRYAAQAFVAAEVTRAGATGTVTAQPGAAPGTSPAKVAAGPHFRKALDAAVSFIQKHHGQAPSNAGANSWTSITDAHNANGMAFGQDVFLAHLCAGVGYDVMPRTAPKAQLDQMFASGTPTLFRAVKPVSGRRSLTAVQAAQQFITGMHMFGTQAAYGRGAYFLRTTGSSQQSAIDTCKRSYGGTSTGLIRLALDSTAKIGDLPGLAKEMQTSHLAAARAHVEEVKGRVAALEQKYSGGAPPPPPPPPPPPAAPAGPAMAHPTWSAHATIAGGEEAPSAAYPGHTWSIGPRSNGRIAVYMNDPVGGSSPALDPTAPAGSHARRLDFATPQEARDYVALIEAARPLRNNAQTKGGAPGYQFPGVTPPGMAGAAANPSTPQPSSPGFGQYGGGFGNYPDGTVFSGSGYGSGWFFSDAVGNVHKEAFAAIQKALPRLQAAGASRQELADLENWNTDEIRANNLLHSNAGYYACAAGYDAYDGDALHRDSHPYITGHRARRQHDPSHIYVVLNRGACLVEDAAIDANNTRHLHSYV